jgi:hypothetical protein
MRRIIVALIIIFLFGSCRSADKSSLIIGIWVYEKSFIYFTDNNKFITGIFESGYTAGGKMKLYSEEFPNKLYQIIIHQKLV